LQENGDVAIAALKLKQISYREVCDELSKKSAFAVSAMEAGLVKYAGLTSSPAEATDVVVLALNLKQVDYSDLDRDLQGKTAVI
jgi:hypothetical protein